MAILTRQELRDYWAAQINTNGTNSITGQKLNTGGIDIIDSMAMGTELPTPHPVTVNGYGSVGEAGNISYSKTIVQANTWEIFSIGSPQLGTMDNITFLPLTNELLLDFPVTAGTPIYVTFTMNTSVDLLTTPARTLDVTHAVNGVTNPNAAWHFVQLAQTNTVPTNFIPISYTWSGIMLNSDDGINIMVKSNIVGAFHGRGYYITITGSVTK